MADQVARDRDAVTKLSTQVAADKTFIIAHAAVLEEKANRVQKQAKSVTTDRVEINVMKKAVLAEKKTIIDYAARITKETNRFIVAKTNL